MKKRGGDIALFLFLTFTGQSCSLMSVDRKTIITLETTIEAPVDVVWTCWTTPEIIMRWNHASDDWHTPAAVNDLRPGGQFTYHMAAKDGSFGFDFGGTYDEVEHHKRIAYTLGDGRKVEIDFSSPGEVTHIRESFETEDMNPVDLQRSGWQAILDNFKKYTESIR